MSSALLTQAQDLRKTDPKRAEALYKQILEQHAQKLNGSTESIAERDQNLKVQEVALVNLAEVYRDAK